MSKTSRSILLLALLPALVACREPGPAQRRVALTPCQLSAPNGPEREQARCGTLAVPEDHRRPDGRRIDLRIAVLPATGSAPVADPVYLLAGGPGQAATEAFVPLFPALSRLRQHRDLVMVDLRGTGGSAPLRCPALEALAASPESTSDDLERAAEVLRGCARAEKADLAAYTTAEAVADLEDVRAALGHERINLLGISYGTRLAQAYLRRHPRRARTVVLDAVVDPTTPLFKTTAEDAQASLDRLFQRCQGEAACAAALPDLPGSLTRVLARLAEAPAEVALPHPRTAAPATLRLTRRLLANTLFRLSYAAEQQTLLPLFLHRAAAGDLRPLAAQVLMGADLDQRMNLMLLFSVLCAEDAAPLRAAPPPPGGYLADGPAPYQLLRAVCSAWPAPRLDLIDQRAPAMVDTPALLLSGDLDPITPPRAAEAALALLPRGRHLVISGQGHGSFQTDCVPRLVADFVQTQSAAALSTDCLSQHHPPPIPLSELGPRP